MTNALDNSSTPAPPPLPSMHTPTLTQGGSLSGSNDEIEPKIIPQTPEFDASKVVDALPTPSSTSDGRSQAAQLLKERINAMQDEDTIDIVGASNLFPSSPSPLEGGIGDPDDDSRIVDFCADDGEKSCGTNEQQLRNEKNEALASMALLQAELLATRGRHEEEKREWMKSMNELKRRNEELEGRLSLYTLEDSKQTANVRSTSLQTTSGGETGEYNGGGARRFGIRAFAQRFGSPAIRDVHQPPLMNNEENISIPTTIVTNGIDAAALNPNTLKADISLNDSEQQLFLIENVSALEQKLNQSEHRAKVLEQRLQIVKESGDAVIRSLNEELSDVAEDRARSESAMIKELAALDSQRRNEKEEYEKRIDDWIALDERRSLEVKEYERRIQSLLEVIKNLDSSRDCTDFLDRAIVPVSSTSFDIEAENEMYQDLIGYLELLSQRRQLVRSVNEAFDVEFNANPNVADEMIDYYKTRPELKEFTLKSELPRMDYEVLVPNGKTGEGTKLTSTDDVRNYFSSLEEENITLDEEVEIILRAANQSLLADPLAMLTGEGNGRLVHFGSFHSTLIATFCSFQLDLRREGERRIKVNCELAVCVPSGLDGVGRVPENKCSPENAAGKENEDKIEQSATLELARANLAIQFSPSPTSTPSGPLVKYTLLDVKPMITNYEEGGEDAHAMRMAAAALARDKSNNIRVSQNQTRVNRSTVASRFMSRFSNMGIRTPVPDP